MLTIANKCVLAFLLFVISNTPIWGENIQTKTFPLKSGNGVVWQTISNKTLSVALCYEKDICIDMMYRKEIKPTPPPSR